MKHLIIFLFFGLASCKPVVIEGLPTVSPIAKPEIFVRDSAIVMKYGQVALNLYLPKHSPLMTTTVLVTSDTLKETLVNFSNFSIFYILCNDTLKPVQSVTRKLTLKQYSSESFDFQYPTNFCSDSIRNYFIMGSVEFTFAESRK